MSNVLRTIWAANRQPIRSTFIQKRNISRTSLRNDKPSVQVASESLPKENPATVNPSAKMGMTHQVKTYHKYALVWAGKYKSVAEVPERVSHGVLDSALNKARIKIAIYMMIATAVWAGAMVYSGKQAVKRGENLAVTGLQYQRDLREQGLKEKAEAETAAAKAK